MDHFKTFLTPWIISLINVHQLKRLPNINQNSKLHPGLTQHYRNLFLLKIFKNYIKKEDLSQKNKLHNDYKIYRNRNSILMKRSKQYYFTNYFESNLANIKNTWKSIKSIISMKSSSLIPPTLLTFQNETIDNPKRIANIFNNYFSTVSSTEDPS